METINLKNNLIEAIVVVVAVKVLWKEAIAHQHNQQRALLEEIITSLLFLMIDY